MSKELLNACLNSDIDTIKLLISQGVNVDCQYPNGSPVLMEACSKNHDGGSFEPIELLINAGADVNSQNRSGHSPIMIGFNSKISEFLINNGARVDLQSTNGRTALTAHIEQGNLDVVNLILDNGADVDVQDNAGKTALMECLCWDQLEICDLLLERGAKVDIQDCNGDTALIISAQDGFAFTELLLTYGADEKIKNNAGECAMDYIDEMYNKKTSALYESIILARNISSDDDALALGI